MAGCVQHLPPDLAGRGEVPVAKNVLDRRRGSWAAVCPCRKMSVSLHATRETVMAVVSDAWRLLQPVLPPEPPPARRCMISTPP